MKLLSLKHVLIGIVLLIIGSLLYLFYHPFYGGTNFRSMQDKISVNEEIDLRGLRELKASGGTFPRLLYLTWRLNNIKEKKILIDLKLEKNGYIKGIPATHFGYYKYYNIPTLKDLIRRYIFTGSIENNMNLILSEEEEVKKWGFDYKHLEIGSKYVASDENVDEFVNFFDTLPANVWVHFHCVRGKGRTSIALVMYDIFRNAPQVPLDQIVRRQYLLGSVNVFDTVLWKNPKYTVKQLEDRKKFIENFYAFIVQRKADGIQLWSEWRRQQENSSFLPPSFTPVKFKE
jgi:hypothetical protein